MPVGIIFGGIIGGGTMSDGGGIIGLNVGAGGTTATCGFVAIF